MIIKTVIETYELLKERIAEIAPEIQVDLITSDENLFKLGFTDRIPCVVEIVATEDQINRLIDLCYDFEASGYDFPEKSPEYIKYKRYAWIATWFN
ncbi:MAG: hypothetical protein EOM28_11525 [Clostridia bacterium]|nr:hypothetical protein [Clostridia bacterium]